MGRVGDILIVGGGIGGLTLALCLHQRGIPCRVFESAPEIRPVGVGVNLLPHAVRVYARLGLQPALAKVAVETAEAAFFNRYGQLIYREPLGRRAGYEWPQFSIHRADLHAVLLRAVKERLGEDALRLDHHCVSFTQDESSVTLRFRNGGQARGRALIGCDGIHSAIRAQLYPEEGGPRYSGVNMWRGVTRAKPILSGASMVRAGWLATGKLVYYPIRNDVDADGRQLVNWLWEIETPQHRPWDWNRKASVEDFIHDLEDWTFDWLDVPALFRAADLVLEYPMVDKDPLPAWSFGRVTLLGDAAHPMYPRGSNGAGQAVLDAECLADRLSRSTDVPSALKEYEQHRLGPTARVVLENRSNPPDAILREVYERTGDKPFDRIEAVISPDELRALSERYKKVAGYDQKTLKESKTMTISRHDQTAILSQAVEHGNTVYLAGVVAKNLKNDVKGQTKEILDEIDRLLAKCGSNKSKVMSATIWVTDIRNRAPMNEVWTAWVDPKNLPARACVEAKLADPNALVEIMVIAAK